MQTGNTVTTSYTSQQQYARGTAVGASEDWRSTDSNVDDLAAQMPNECEGNFMFALTLFNVDTNQLQTWSSRSTPTNTWKLLRLQSYATLQHNGTH